MLIIPSAEHSNPLPMIIVGLYQGQVTDDFFKLNGGLGLWFLPELYIGHAMNMD